MRCSPTLLLLVGIITKILLEAWVCESCWKQEREALLNLKHHFKISPTAQNWPTVFTGHNSSATSDDCCRWEGVECNAATGRVAALSVRGILDGYPIDCEANMEICMDLGNSSASYVNASWFLPFRELRRLDLSGNYLVNWDDSQGLKRTSSQLSNLEILDLSFNYLDDGILQPLGALPALKSLYLRGNLMMAKLQVTDLPNVDKLEHLNLDLLPFDNVSFGNIGLMTSLTNLSLHGCGLDGTLLDVEGICQLVHMKNLDISNNNLKGDLPWCLKNMTSLQWLDLSSNQFTGDLSLSPLTHLMSLEYLKLSDNLFDLPFSLSPFFNLSKLKYLDATNIQVYEETEPNILPPSPKFQLLAITLRPSRALVGSFPEFLYYQSDLLNVDLTNLEMEEGSHNWLMKNNTRLEMLTMINTSLSGHIQLPITPNVHLSHLDFSHNVLSGLIPEAIGVSFPRLKLLNLSGNSFSGPIPASIGNMSSLETLDLSRNRLSGGLPEQLATGCYSLQNLILTSNSLQGEMLPYRSRLKNMKELFLNNNFFQAGIPDSLRNSPSLVVLDLSNNSLSGQIPAWIGKLPDLQVLDLSHNKLNGSIPSGLSPPSLNHLHLSHNQLQGPLGDALTDCPLLMTLDLSHNQLTGEISDWIGSFYGSLNYLLLSYNKFEGEIPPHFCSFTQLGLIDLSHNNLSGPIFPCLSDHLFWDGIAQGPSSVESLPPIPPQEPLQFTTKNNSYSYSGKILESMSGIDLSCNRLTGKIPPEIANISNLIALNLSHNDLTGEIPPSMSQLYRVESLDLSYNSLSGKIPPQLTGLYSLELFSVAYNNLSGKVPDQVAQFGTFDSISYQGNPYLCGPPLATACTGTPSPSLGASVRDEGDEGFIDTDAFLITFSASYICVLLSFAAVLQINPQWRRQWLYFVELSTAGIYYYVSDSLAKLCKKISGG